MRRRSTRSWYAMSAIAVAAIGFGLWTGGASARTKEPAVARQGNAAEGHQAMTATGCAGSCFSLYSRRIGTGQSMNAYIPGDTGTGGRVGRLVNLSPAMNFRPNSNFTPSVVGQVRQFCGAEGNKFFSPTSYVCVNYPNSWLFEADWSPSGDQSDLCAGVAVVGQSDEAVTLQQCGASDRTLWIGDRTNGRGGDCRYPGDYCAWVSASDAHSGPPLVLTVVTGSRVLPNQLRIEPLLLAGRFASNVQQFAYFWGPVV